MTRTEMTREAMEALVKDKDVKFMRLWDLYNGLLTETQRELTNLYFNCDLSLGEIAEEKGISRQSVSDCLKKCRKRLEACEEKLHFAKALDEVCGEYSAYMTRVDRWMEKQREKHPEWAGELDELKETLEKDMDIIEVK